MKSRLIIDITELHNWRGRLTGVPRVMNELSMRFSKDSNVIFVTWQEVRKRYEIVTYVPRDDTPATTDASISTSRRSLKDVVKKIIRNSKWLSKLVEVILNPARRTKNGVVRRLKRGPECEVSAGDTLVILADWHGLEKSFIPHVVKLQSDGVKIVQFSHDLLPLVTPQYAGHATKLFRKYVENIYPICERIMVNSENTKKDVINWLNTHDYNVPEVDVVRLGDDFERRKAIRPSRKSFVDFWNEDQPFIVCVGTIEARKNHLLLYYAYKLALSKGIKLPKCIIIGRRGWMSDLAYEAITGDPEVKGSFLHMQGVSDGELAWLYNNSIFSIYPSLYEGWGLPVAESLANGVPCLTSNVSSMPEIAGNLARYFSPYSTEECLEGILNLLDEDVRGQAVADAKKYKPHSWDDTFKEAKKTLEKVL